MSSDLKYQYETFSASAGEFDRRFTDYLNDKASRRWKVKSCNFCHDTDNSKMFASCLFKHRS